MLHLGDIHSKYAPYYNYGIDKFTKWLDATLPDAGKENTEIILAGDMLDKVMGESAHTSAMAPIVEVLKRKTKYIYAILGNHDYGIKSLNRISNTEFLESLGIIVIKDLCEYTTRLGFHLLCLPWTPYHTFNQVNDFVREHTTKQYDSVVAHWEIKPLFTDDFVDISNVKSLCKAVGHIHTKTNDPCYIGSVLPNASSEMKYEDRLSVIRSLIKTDTGSRVVDIKIPSFVTIQFTTIKKFEDLKTLESREDLFYKIRFNNANLEQKEILAYLKEHNIGLYKIESTNYDIQEFNTEVSDVPLEGLTLNISKEEIIEECVEALSITDKELALLKSYISQS